MTAADTADAADAVGRLCRWHDDFPAPGVRFADLTPVFADSDGLRVVIDALASAAPDADIVAGIDARGFLLGAGVAIALGRGVVAVRKGGKLPPPVRSRSYQLEYGSATLEVPAEGIDLAGKRVLLVDDVLATGGTAVAAAELMRDAGARVDAVAVVLELTALRGRERIADYPLTALVRV